MQASIVQWLSLSGLSVRAFSGGPSALEHLDEHFAGAVLSDVKMPAMDGLELQRRIAQIDPDIPVVLFTGHGDIAMAVEAMRNGAYDFLEKPFEPDRLLDVLARALEKRRLVLDNRALRIELNTMSELDGRLYGSTPKMRDLKREILTIAKTDASVLIVGETGTGKEIVARALHDHSSRANGPFVAVNCAAIPDLIAESELFGHEKGAFTGAEARRAGKLEAAAGGTLFLDEAASMSRPVQQKLLRALEQREIVRLGAVHPIRTDFRLVTAINQPAEAIMSEGLMRQDIYYRIATVELLVPPLRERKDDLPQMFMLFASRAAEAYERDVPPLGSAGLAALLAHDWPGNVRELRNVAERFVLSSLPVDNRLDAVLQRGATPIEGAGLRDQVHSFERYVISDALKRSGGDIRRVLAELDIPRRTLNEKMVRHGLSRPAAVDSEQESTDKL